MKNIFVFLLLCYLSLQVGLGQNNPDIKRTMHWYFGNKAGIDFSSGSPVAVTNSQMDFVADGSVSISDTSGNLLFYSDGWKVWNRIHQVMPNGNDLIAVAYGAPTTSQILSVPQPEHNNIHYIFSLGYDSTLLDGEWRYSIVDMNLQSGLGDVVTKRNLLCNNATETICAVRHSNKNDIWIITMSRNTNSFYAYLLTNTGLSSTPVISNAGLSTNKMNYLEASPDGSKLAVTFGFNGPEILDFDKTTGIVSNPVIFPPLSGQRQSFGASFSPDSKKMYYICTLEITPAVTWTNPVYQIDLSGTPTQILNSKVLLDSVVISDSACTNFADNFTYAFQLGPDNKIYGSKYTRSKLCVINSPNTLGIGCNYIDSALSLQGRICYFGLPNFMNDYFYTDTTNAVIETGSSENKMAIYPNPFTDFTTIEFQGEEFATGDLIIYDLFCREVSKIKITNRQTKFERGKLPAGIYILKVEIKNKIYPQKIIIN